MPEALANSYAIFKTNLLGLEADTHRVVRQGRGVLQRVGFGIRPTWFQALIVTFSPGVHLWNADDNIRRLNEMYVSGLVAHGASSANARCCYSRGKDSKVIWLELL